MYSGDLQGKQERSLVINYIFEFVACLFLLPFYGRKFITWLVNCLLTFSQKNDSTWSHEYATGFSSEIYRGINKSGYEFSLNHIAFFLGERKPCFIYTGCVNVAIFKVPRFQESQFHTEYVA